MYVLDQMMWYHLTIVAHFLLRTFVDSMRSLTGGKKPWRTKLSSAGLLYLHFGHRVISTITGECRCIFIPHACIKNKVAGSIPILC